MLQIGDDLNTSNEISHIIYRVTKEALIKVVSAAQERFFDEELKELERTPDLEMSLQTDYGRGLKGNDFEERIRKYGHNRKPIVVPKSFCELLNDALKDFIMRVLLVAGVLSIIIEMATVPQDQKGTAWVEGFAIMVAVFTCCIVTAANDYQKERQFQQLNALADGRKTVTVWRDGDKVDLHMSMVLVGDIIQIFEGMEIPADCLVLEAAELTADESAMTGETDPVKKDILENCIKVRNTIQKEGQMTTSGRHDVPSPILLSGTRVLSGEGKMVVLVVGDSSCVGKISALLRQDDPVSTPLQQKLETIAQDIGKFGLISACVIVLVLLLRFAIERIQQNSFTSDNIADILNFIILGITVIVVAIPEGLPLAVTLTLAYSTMRMLADNNLVRKMAACETMGGADMICSDKTGTLTQNKMSLVQIWNEQAKIVDLYSPKINITDYVSKDLIELYTLTTIVNGTAMIRPEEKGSKTEIAMINFIERCGYNYETLRESYQPTMKIPFSSKRKRMSMIVNNMMVTKGASEIILEACTEFHSAHSQIEPITSSIKHKIETAIHDMASASLRTIAIAYKNITVQTDLETKDVKGVYEVEKQGFTLIGILGIKDILREEVPHAVAACKVAGIKVRMVTGDNKITARAIAKECGILIDEKSLVMEGPEFIQKIGGVICKLCQTHECDCPRDSNTAKCLGKAVRIDTIQNGQAFDEIYPRLDVLARSRPEDKYALVTGLIERGHIVAVTGDGTNDAPALKKADVGFAMGIAGTEVARESAAIILLDDNFSSIVKAVMWGRNIYDSIKKFLQFQLTVNIVAVFLTFIGAVLLKQEVLEPIQMLWVNLIMDTFASLALATETPTEELLNRKPHNRSEYIISPKMFKHIFGQSVYQLIILIIMVFAADNFIPEYGGDEGSSYYKNNMHFKYSDTNHGQCSPGYCTIISSGRYYYINGDNDYKEFYKQSQIASRHFTFIFNLFVIMQLFNFVNSRRIYDEINIFERIFSNNLFPIIVVGIFIAQVIIVTFGGIVFHCFPFYGLRVQHWLICIAFGFGGMLWNMALKFLPDVRIRHFHKRRSEELYRRQEQELINEISDLNSRLPS